MKTFSLRCHFKRVTHVLILLCQTVLSSCFLWSGPSLSALPPNKAPSALSGSKISAHPLADNPDVVELRSQQGALLWYASAQRLCSARVRPGVQLSVARQLFVGFDNLRLLEHNNVILFGEPAITFTAQAEIDHLPISMKSYTYIRHACLYDVVFWTKHTTQQRNQFDELSPILEPLLQELGWI